MTDFDRDENGELTDEGRAQLVAWHMSVGLLAEQDSE